MGVSFVFILSYPIHLYLYLYLPLCLCIYCYGAFIYLVSTSRLPTFAFSCFFPWFGMVIVKYLISPLSTCCILNRQFVFIDKSRS